LQFIYNAQAPTRQNDNYTESHPKAIGITHCTIHVRQEEMQVQQEVLETDFQGKPHGGMRIILGFSKGGARCCIVGIAPVITLKTLVSRPAVEGHKWEGCNQLPLSFQLVSHNRGH
jgi:hypothetical protein